MKCEICNENDAVVHFKHVDDGKVRELNICEDCAAKNGLSIQPPDLLTDFLMGKVEKPSFDDTKQEAARQCVVCGMKEADFNKLSRLGCASCYEAFEKDIEDIVVNTQQGSRHIGKYPASLSSDEDVAQLKGLIEEAVEVQNFEEAARLRDIIDAIEQHCKTGEAGKG